MLQYTLARDSLLVGFGSARDSDASPLDVKPEAKKGARPSLFFAPTRDAHGLLTRKTFSHIILLRRVPLDGAPRAIVLPLPTNEWISDSHLQTLCPATDVVTVANCTLRDSRLLASVDVSRSSFDFESSDIAKPITLHLESFVFENRLREQWHLEGVPAEFAAFVVHWHQPEIRGSALLQTTYASMSLGSLASYHAGLFFGLSVSQNNASVSPAFASCVPAQGGHSAVADFATAFASVLKTLRQLGSGAPAAVRSQVLQRWTTDPSDRIATGTSEGLMLWPVDAALPFELTFSFASSLEAVLRPNGSTFATARARVSEDDAAWLKQVQRNRDPLDLPSPVRSLYERSLLTLKQMQDPLGGIIAAPEFQFEFTACGGYGYCWGRDAGFISLAMDMAGMFDESEHFYAYMARCQAENGSFLHRHDMGGHLGPSWGLLQPDETGSVLFGLWQHVKLSGKTEGAARLRDVVERAAHWLANYRYEDTDWLGEGFDLWEEREGVHLYSVAAAVAGLRAAALLAEKMQWPVPAVWRERADVLSRLLEENLVVSKSAANSSFARTLFLKTAQPQQALAVNSAQPPRWATDYVVDVSLLGVVEPFEAVSKAYAQTVLPDLCRAVRQQLWRAGVGGIGRYEGDHYRDGQPWILTTLWLALAAARCGDEHLAVECCSWVLKHTPVEGQLPEQIDPATGEPAWVMPLTWSHAMFVLACCQLPKGLWISVINSESAFSQSTSQSTSQSPTPSKSQSQFHHHS